MSSKNETVVNIGGGGGEGGSPINRSNETTRLTLEKQQTGKSQGSPKSCSKLTAVDLDKPIPLSKFEEELFSLLLDVATQPDVPPVTLRVAGGWVRDKILFPTRDLGKEVDIDIALDTMLGNEFADLINKYMRARDMDVSGIGLIQKNPDQSKHLETATMRVQGMWLDLVNLRTETYSHDSRIPDVQIGTPKEDALRRDLTINALFYNIGTRSLEDFTGKGFDDIRARLIRTPLPPLTTLLDDPLRALRAVRFAARLNFCIDDQLSEACKHPEVHEALESKVSRERISGELHRILADGNAPHAIALLVEFGLFPVVIRMPQPNAMLPGQQLPADFPLAALSALINLHSVIDADGWWAQCPAKMRLVRYAALLGPVAGLRCCHAELGKKKKKEMDISQYVMRVELRLGASDANTISALLDGALSFKHMVHEGKEQLDRLTVAATMRQTGKFWRNSLRIALIMELPVVEPKDSFAKVLDEYGGHIELGREALLAVDTYKQFKAKIDQLDMDGVWDIKPVVNGNELSKILPKMKRGPLIGRVMKEQVDWMVEHPGKAKEDVVDWIKTKFSDLV